ncbi:hypothetical protein BCR32DRAFT_230247 [Anaeromyces robustus]|uniref:separase n=1 Tax=Anaeromyces robustus TaxID=1754192 RepID=A0A1Y1XG53_9FUNG|nr:hypothetical protein BCR32DRAFT_230247 [Anaeromyces robustus]|eukprot:ORX84693.1 hypothetical protein BCR32DRAFT_230247 [Anaeromyces robustus]
MSINDMANDCYPLFIYNNHILLQQALIYKNINTQETINRINIKNIKPFTAEEYLIYTSIILSDFIHKLTLNPHMDYIFESASSLLISHINWLSSIIDNDDANNINISQLSLIEKYLTKALSLSYNKDIPEIFRKLSLNILYINIIKSFLLSYNSSLIINQQIINKCAFLLELSKGLTYRRELFEIINNKLLNPDLLKKKEKTHRVIWPNQKLSDDEIIIKQYQKNFEKENDEDLRLNIILYDKYAKEEVLNYDFFQENYINIIPNCWTVCSITFDVEHYCFYICKYHKNMSPIIFHIPIKRHISHKKLSSLSLSTSNSYFEFDKGINYLKNILYKENNNSEMTQYSNYTEDEKLNNISSEEKANWWNERIDLDRHLEETLIKMEVSWIGGFKGILCPIIKNYQKERQMFKQDLEKFIENIIFKQDENANFIEFDQNICDCFLYLKDDALDCELEDVIYYLLDYYQSYGIKIDYTRIDIDMQTRILRKILQKYKKLKLYDFDEHIILIPDKQTEIIPWENLPILHDRPTSRILSLSLLRDRILFIKNQDHHSPNSIDKYIIDANHSTYYILNPGGDLMNTQNKFQDQFENKTHWIGISGKEPTEEEYLNGLKNYQLLMYFGHGGGECYIKGRTIRNNIKSKCAVTLLMGCSSGLLKTSGDYDPTGNSINYILGQSPALTANLWDVTDRDIDRLTQGLLEEWGIITEKNEENDSLYYKLDLLFNDDNDNNTLVLARRRCKLKYLIGAATVIYGIPVYNKIRS